jgi:hypothetical protein
MNCACGKKLCWGNKTGMCRACINADPAFIARRADAIRKAFQHNPEYRVRHIEALAASNRRPDRRARSGQLARELRIWEKGLPNVTAASHAETARKTSEARLAHIPLAYRDEYKRLVRKIGAKDAARVILDLADANARRAHA